jgi:hypothetical protein
MAIRGGCLCGAMRYEVKGPLFEVSNCHCSMCRRFHGAAFSSYAKFAPDDFRWLQGQAELKVYEPSPGKGWAFCGRCGSSLGLPGGGGQLIEIALGSVDGDPDVRPAEHIFVGSKAPWYEIRDSLPQYEERPPAGGVNQPILP